MTNGIIGSLESIRESQKVNDSLIAWLRDDLSNAEPPGSPVRLDSLRVLDLIETLSDTARHVRERCDSIAASLGVPPPGRDDASR